MCGSSLNAELNKSNEKKKKQDNQENNTDKTFYAIKEMMFKF